MEVSTLHYKSNWPHDVLRQERIKVMRETASQISGNPLFLDDLFVGQRFSSASHAVRGEEIVAFARQFDPQPFHLDAEAAKGTLFSGLAASGWHTAALTMRLNVEGGLPFAGGLVGAGAEITWPKALRPGDVIHVESEVAEIVPSRSRPDRAIVTVVSRTLDQNGDAVQILKAKMVVFRKPTA
jgi:acyl dehydratase